jgi:4'-phosphopantetheinyl transferase
LRAILGRYLDTDALELRLAYGPFGKPAVAFEQVRSPFGFSLSHSAGLVLLAIAAYGEVGIDVEWIDARFDCQRVAASFFSPQEIDELQRAPIAHTRQVFFRLWSLREAVGKSRGDGLAVFDDRGDLGWAVGESDPFRGCSVTDLDVGEGYTAALALHGPWEMRLRPWHERLEGWNACYRVGLEPLATSDALEGASRRIGTIVPRIRG